MDRYSDFSELSSSEADIDRLIARISDRTSHSARDADKINSAISNVLSLLFEDDYITIDELKSALSFAYTPTQLESLWKRLPCLTDLVRFYKAGSILMPGPPQNLTFLDMEDIGLYPFSLTDENLQLDGDCPARNTFLVFEDVPACQWIILLKEGVADSFGKSIERQYSKLLGRQFVPSAVVYHYCASVYGLVRNRDLLGKLKFRTSSVSANGHSITVQSGRNNTCRLSDVYDDNKISSELGLACMYVV
jgi:hypothetical protein